MLSQTQRQQMVRCTGRFDSSPTEIILQAPEERGNTTWKSDDNNSIIVALSAALGTRMQDREKLQKIRSALISVVSWLRTISEKQKPPRENVVQSWRPTSLQITRTHCSTNDQIVKYVVVVHRRTWNGVQQMVEAHPHNPKDPKRTQAEDFRVFSGPVSWIVGGKQGEKEKRVYDRIIRLEGASRDHRGSPWVKGLDDLMFALRQLEEGESVPGSLRRMEEDPEKEKSLMGLEQWLRSEILRLETGGDALTAKELSKLQLPPGYALQPDFLQVKVSNGTMEHFLTNQTMGTRPQWNPSTHLEWHGMDSDSEWSDEGEGEVSMKTEKGRLFT